MYSLMVSVMCLPRLSAWHVHRGGQTQLLRRKVNRFRGGLVFETHRLLYHSTLGLRVMKKKKAGEVRELLDTAGHENNFLTAKIDDLVSVSSILGLLYCFGLVNRCEIRGGY